MKIKILASFFFCAIINQMAYAKTVNSLSEVDGQIKSKEISSMYQKQMHGVAPQDSFGSLKRSDKNVPALLKLLNLPQDTSKLGLLSLRKWQANQFILVACSQTNPINIAYLEHKDAFAECDTNVDTINVALISKNAKNEWQLLANPYHEKLANLTEQQSAVSAFTLDSRDESDVIGKLDHLDIADYQLNTKTKAFGIRFTASSSYAGGGAVNQAMTLFANINGRIMPILKTPTYKFADIAGEWNKDGTRQHDVESHEYVLVLSNQQMNGYKNIMWREKGTKISRQKIYHWNKNSNTYQ